jgi:hypothetical protein
MAFLMAFLMAADQDPDGAHCGIVACLVDDFAADRITGDRRPFNL